MKRILIPATILMTMLFLSGCQPSTPIHTFTTAPESIAPSQSPSSMESSALQVQPITTATMINTPISGHSPTPEEGESIEPDKNLLVMIDGEARISHDNGNSWTATGSGQWLETGDEIQFSQESTAFIFFFNGAIMRLEGPSDYQLVLSEFDPESGATRIINRLWDGYALFETNPLPTPDSIFQLHVMTSFIDVAYDKKTAAVGASIELDPDLSIIAGGLLDEENEMLFHFRGEATLYVLDWEEEQYLAEAFMGDSQAITTLEISFLEDFFVEASLEGFSDIAGLLIRQYKQSGNLDDAKALGYGIEEIEELETGELIYYFESEEMGRRSNCEDSLISHSIPHPSNKLFRLIQPNPTPTAGSQSQST